jgi:LuxR family transcriptional regulator, maltose regulon positive regulatory protein
MRGYEAARQVVGDSYGEAFPVSRLAQYDPRAAAAALAPIRDGSISGVHLIRVAAALLLEVINNDGTHDTDAGRSVDLADLSSEVADLLDELNIPAPRSGEPAWPEEPLTEGEIRVLRYLPTHLSAPEIAAELHLSANTVKTHLRHLYRKLGAHSRHEVVERARLMGMVAALPRRP